MSCVATDLAVIIVGYGNELRRDDGAGCEAARRLEAHFHSKTYDAVAVLSVHQLLPELSAELARAKLAIFIDADERLSPGAMARSEIDSRPVEESLGHHQTPEGLLHMAKTLYGHSPRGVLYSIGMADDSTGEGLSKFAQDAVDSVVREAANEVQQIVGIKKSLPKTRKRLSRGQHA